MAKDNAKLLEGIAYFEKMLNVMPGDRTTLEFLSLAYEQLGDEEKTRRALIQLAATLLRENDLDAADVIAERLRGYEQDDARQMADRVRAARVGTAPAKGTDTPPDAAEKVSVPVSDAPGTDTAQTGTDTLELDVAHVVFSAVKAEAALVRQLSAANIVDPTAAEVVQKYLGGLPEPTRPFLVSALAILEKECGTVGQKAAVYLADTAGAPPVNLVAFAPGPDLIARLPETLVRVRAAVPFGTVGATLLVAVLNPMDAALRAEIERLARVPCRFFLADPHTTEDYLEKLFGSNEK